MKTINKKLTHAQSERLIRGIIVVLVLLLCWYIVSRFIRIITGPSLVTYAASTVDESYPALLQIQGVTKNTEKLFINDHMIIPATDGGFDYTIITQPGYALIEFKAYDRFNNEVTETLALYTDEPPDALMTTLQQKPIEDTDVESEESQAKNNS